MVMRMVSMGDGDVENEDGVIGIMIMIIGDENDDYGRW